MTRCCKVLSLVALLTSVFFFSLGLLTGVGRVVEARSSNGLRVLEPRLSCGILRLRENTVVNFTVSNPTDRTIRLIGARSGCSQTGCLGPSHYSLPLAVSPGGRCILPVLVSAKGTGEFDMRLPFFTDDPEMPEIEVAVTGRMVDRAEAQ